MQFLLKKVSVMSFVALASIASAGDTLLTVSGDIVPKSGQGLVEFDLADLQSLPTKTILTETIWTDGQQSFTGVPLADLLDTVGAQAGTLRAVALNDYAVNIPTSDAVTGGPIVAYFRNGEEMSVRDRGPLWVIYPYDENVAYKTEEYYSRSIWQLDRIEVLAED